jgi:hypothetical protein
MFTTGSRRERQRARRDARKLVGLTLLMLIGAVAAVAGVLML